MHTIALMPGDGIGPEITRAAVAVIESTGVRVQWIALEGGEGARQKHGTPLPDETLESYVQFGVGFKGPFAVEMEDAVVSPEWRRGIPGGRPRRSYNSATNALRRDGRGFAAVRVAKNFSGVPAPVQGIDLLIVREINEDVYVASEYTVGDDTAVALKIISRKASERVIRFAFEFATAQGRRKVTVIHKANVLRQTDGLFVKVAREVSREYPGIEYEEQFIDAACALVVARPSLFDVAVMPNQYGDIMSDLCSSAAGSLGLGAGATYGMEASLFEPVHGTAPDIAGKGIANPISQILSGVPMLKHLREDQAARAIDRAVEDALLSRDHHTPDLGGKATTDALTQAIIDRIPQFMPKQPRESPSGPPRRLSDQRIPLSQGPG